MASLLKQLRAELEQVIGEEIEAVYLYGSRARGEARSDSDVDILVVLRHDFHYFDMVEGTGEIAARLSLQYDTVISLAFSTAEKFHHQRIPFYLNIKREGIVDMNQGRKPPGLNDSIGLMEIIPVRRRFYVRINKRNVVRYGLNFRADFDKV